MFKIVNIIIFIETSINTISNNMNVGLEMNKLNTKPVTVEYAITETGLTLGNVLGEMSAWSIEYRKNIQSND